MFYISGILIYFTKYKCHVASLMNILMFKLQQWLFWSDQDIKSYQYVTGNSLNATVPI